jgi:hypothetical protein
MIDGASQRDRTAASLGMLPWIHPIGCRIRRKTVELTESTHSVQRAPNSKLGKYVRTN